VLQLELEAQKRFRPKLAQESLVFLGDLLELLRGGLDEDPFGQQRCRGVPGSESSSFESMYICEPSSLSSRKV